MNPKTTKIQEQYTKLNVKCSSEVSILHNLKTIQGVLTLNIKFIWVYPEAHDVRIMV